MSIDSLYDLKNEISRYYIAGSRFAIGDTRLNKYIQMYTKLGEKSAVFKSLATTLEELVNSDEKECVTKLSKLSTLVYSILNTQTKATTAEDKTELTYSNANFKESTLTFNDIENFKFDIDCTDRLQDDIRLFWKLESLLQIKHQSYTNNIKLYVLPHFGANLAWFFYANYDMEAPAAELKFKFMSKHLKEQITPLSIKILESDNKNLKNIAIESLGYDKANEDLILSYAQSKNGKTISSVLKALGLCGSKYLKEHFIKALNTKPAAVLESAVYYIDEKEYSTELTNHCNKLIDEFIESMKDTENKPAEQEKLLNSIYYTAFYCSKFDNEEVYNTMEKLFTSIPQVFEQSIAFNYYERDEYKITICEKLIGNCIKKSEKYNLLLHKITLQHLTDKELLNLLIRDNNTMSRPEQKIRKQLFIFNLITNFRTSINLYGAADGIKKFNSLIDKNKSIKNFGVIEYLNINYAYRYDFKIDNTLTYDGDIMITPIMETYDSTFNSTIKYNSDVFCYFASLLFKGAFNSLVNYYKWCNVSDEKFETIVSKKFISIYNKDELQYYIDIEAIVNLDNQKALALVFKIVNNLLKKAEPTVFCNIIKEKFQAYPKKASYPNLVNYYHKNEE